jgi:hypothetical protein
VARLWVRHQRIVWRRNEVKCMPAIIVDLDQSLVRSSSTIVPTAPAGQDGPCHAIAMAGYGWSAASPLGREHRPAQDPLLARRESPSGPRS